MLPNERYRCRQQENVAAEQRGFNPSDYYISGLSVVVFCRVCSFLDADSIFQVAATSRRLAEVTHFPLSWSALASSFLCRALPAQEKSEQHSRFCVSGELLPAKKPPAISSSSALSAVRESSNSHNSSFAQDHGVKDPYAKQKELLLSVIADRVADLQARGKVPSRIPGLFLVDAIAARIIVSNLARFVPAVARLAPKNILSLLVTNPAAFFPFVFLAKPNGCAWARDPVNASADADAAAASRGGSTAAAHRSGSNESEDFALTYNSFGKFRNNIGEAIAASKNLSMQATHPELYPFPSAEKKKKFFSLIPLLKSKLIRRSVETIFDDLLLEFENAVTIRKTARYMLFNLLHAGVALLVFSLVISFVIGSNDDVVVVAHNSRTTANFTQFAPEWRESLIVSAERGAVGIAGSDSGTGWLRLCHVWNVSLVFVKEFPAWSDANAPESILSQRKQPLIQAFIAVSIIAASVYIHASGPQNVRPLTLFHARHNVKSIIFLAGYCITTATTQFSHLIVTGVVARLLAPVVGIPLLLVANLLFAGLSGLVHGMWHHSLALFHLESSLSSSSLENFNVSSALSSLTATKAALSVLEIAVLSIQPGHLDLFAVVVAVVLTGLRRAMWLHFLFNVDDSHPNSYFTEGNHPNFPTADAADFDLDAGNTNLLLLTDVCVLSVFMVQQRVFDEQLTGDPVTRMVQYNDLASGSIADAISAAAKLALVELCVDSCRLLCGHAGEWWRSQGKHWWRHLHLKKA